MDDEAPNFQTTCTQELSHLQVNWKLIAGINSGKGREDWALSSCTSMDTS
jgi:hypothetical protein